MRPSEKLTKELNLDKLGVNINYMENGYCLRMERKALCSMAKEGNCDRCFPYLRIIVTEDLDSAENKAALVMWRMKAFAIGELNVYTSLPKKQIRSYHQYVDPIKELAKRYGVDDEKSECCAFIELPD